jgi:hypothetical protein
VDSVDTQELHKVACASVGRKPGATGKGESEWSQQSWGKPMSADVSPRKRKAEAQEWGNRFFKRHRIQLQEGGAPINPGNYKRSESRTGSQGSNILVPVTNLQTSNTDLSARIPRPKTPEKSKWKSIKSLSSPRSPNGKEGAQKINPLYSPLSALKINRMAHARAPSIFKDSFVYFHSPDESEETPEYRNAKLGLGKAVPRHLRLWTAEALLTGCGWSNSKMPEAVVKCGMVFLDQSKSEHVRSICDLLSRRVPESGEETSRRPILIFDLQTFISTPNGLEHRALYVVD